MTQTTLLAKLVGQPILAAAGFEPALFVSRRAGFRRKMRSRQGPIPGRMNALRPRRGSACIKRIPN
jgi:hypothetical protein